MQHIHNYSYIQSERPALISAIRGGVGLDNLNGTAAVFRLPEGVYIDIQLYGLPASEIYGLHIHNGSKCNAEDSFSETGEPLSLCPEGTWCDRHPYHAGNLPPAFSDKNGTAIMGAYLDKALVSDLSGHTLVVKDRQSNKTIACGVLSENL